MDTLKNLKRLIILSWIILFLCVIIKLFGGNFFKIVITSDKFIAVCNSIDGNRILKYGIYLVINLISNFIYLLAVCGRKNFNLKTSLILIGVLTIFFFLKVFNEYIGLATDIIQAFIIPLFFIGIKKWYRILIGFILDLSFQLISTFLKGIGFSYVSSEILQIPFMIDYYIMLFLYYLYSYRSTLTLKIRKEKNQDGIMG